MTLVLISSTEDTASTNIKNHLLQENTWKEKNTFQQQPVYQHTMMKNIFLITVNDRLIFHENIDKEIQEQLHITPQQAIFLSRHRSTTAKPTLTTHPIGNYNDNRYGGKPQTLIASSPRLMTHLLRLLHTNAKKANLYHDICFEVTHHGPYLTIPTLYIEVGSNETEWQKQQPAHIIAKSLQQLLKHYHYEKDLPDDIPVLLGIGGGHYAPRFTDIILEKKAAFGHMIPAYHIKDENINITMLKQAIEKTPNIQGIYIHRKSLKKSQITMFKKWSQELGVPTISSKDLPSPDQKTPST
jgi:D-aminoacyl-tRNA deacylase